MHIREYQQWLERWDRARSWQRVTLAHTLLHALEELGEVSKLVQMLEGYRQPEPAELDALRSELALELSDLQVMVFKIAYLSGIDMEEAMLRGQQKADSRFPDPVTGAADQRAYRERFGRYLDASGVLGAADDGGSDAT